MRLGRRGELGSIHIQASCQLRGDVADAAQQLAQQFDELDDVVVQLDVPLAVRGERRVLPEDTRRVRRKEEDELFDLAVFLHLSAEGIDFELSVEDGHRSSEELVRIALLCETVSGEASEGETMGRGTSSMAE